MTMMDAFKRYIQYAGKVTWNREQWQYVQKMQGWDRLRHTLWKTGKYTEKWPVMETYVQKGFL